MPASHNNQDATRKWIKTDLSGSHTHLTDNGYRITICRRDGKYIARGRFQGSQFSETLGSSENEAASRLRLILCDLETDSYLPPCQRKLQMVQTRAIKSPPFSGLVDQYLRDVRKNMGVETAMNYRSKLAHIERFVAQPENSRRWPTVARIDRDFVMEAKAYLHRTAISPNGHSHSKAKPMSPRQIYNVMSACSTMMHWAQRPDSRRLPFQWITPFTREAIGNKPMKDPVRKLPLVDEHVIQLIEHSDGWQLSLLTLSIVFPLRPEESAGLLVEDVDFETKLLRFGTRMEGCDYTKGKQSFVLPFPDQLLPMLQHLIDGRTTGPLLRKRKHYVHNSNETLQSSQDFASAFSSYLMANSVDIHAIQDKKRLFREWLVKQGGVGDDTLSKEFKKIIKQAGIITRVKLYDLRSLNTTKMHQSGVSHLALRYLTGHTTKDILNTYVTLDPHQEILPYFKAIQPVLDLLTRRMMELGICEKI